MDQVNITFFFFFFDTRSHCLVSTDLDFVEQTGFKLKNRPVFFFFYSAFLWEVSFVFILTFCVASTRNVTTLFKVFRSLWFLQNSQSWFLLPSEFCVLEDLKFYKIILYFLYYLTTFMFIYFVYVCATATVESEDNLRVLNSWIPRTELRLSGWQQAPLHAEPPQWLFS